MPQLMNDSKCLERHPLTMEMSLLRRTAHGETFYKDKVIGGIYAEYIEVWRKLSDDPKWELHPDAPKERLSQVDTGRRFLFVDHMPFERYDEDEKFKAETDAMFFIFDPHDFSCYRLHQLHVGDCPMTNSDPATRTSCVCEHWDVERNHLEGGGGTTV